LAIRQFFTGQTAITLLDAPFALVFIGIAWLFNPFLSIFAAAASALMAVLSYFSVKITGPIMKEASSANTEASRVAAGSLRHAETTLALGMLNGVRNRWYEKHSEFLTNQVNASEATGVMGGSQVFYKKHSPPCRCALEHSWPWKVLSQAE
jgi:ABC-type protease/lipase transport system fused ATPase/permease subunit